MIAIQCSERNGKLVGAQLVGSDDEIMLITTGGVLIRTRVSEIRELGRSTQGVRLINLGDNEALAGLEKIVEPEEVANGDLANGNASPSDSAGGGSNDDGNGSAPPDDAA
jgi:DNA gyrase subunit A